MCIYLRSDARLEMSEGKVLKAIFSDFRVMTGKFEINLGYPNCRKNINRKIGNFQETLLHYYARIDQVHEHNQKCKFLLQYGADINSNDSFFKTPLYKAVIVGNLEIVKLLLNSTAYVNSQNPVNKYTLYIMPFRKASKYVASFTIMVQTKTL